ncbi:hypothetical protein [Methanocaldococcus sp.]
MILAILYLFFSPFQPDILGKISLFIVGILYLKRDKAFRFTASLIGFGIFLVSFLTLLTYSFGYIIGLKYNPLEAINISLFLGFLSTIDLFYNYKKWDKDD